MVHGPVMRRELQCAIAVDIKGGPLCDKILRELAEQAILEERALFSGIKFNYLLQRRKSRDGPDDLSEW
jgi:hypothetical protein